jgi:pimeloyl-ACP methyl ester carboxylesterase
MDLPNFSKTGPIVYREGVHAVQARTAVVLLDALGIARAHWVGNSQGGQSAMVAAITYPERVGKLVMGGSHIGTGGDRYLLANRPSEGSRATRRALDDPSRENIAHYLRVHIDDESLVTTSWWTTSTGRTPGHQSSSRRAGNRLACCTTTHKTSPKSRRPSS